MTAARIAAPRWICPAWTAGRQLVEVLVVGAGGANGCRAAVWADGQTAACEVVRCRCAPGGLRLDIEMPEDLPAGLWGLSLRFGQMELRQPNCLAVAGDLSGGVRIVHLSDTHIWKAGGGKIDDRTLSARATIQAVNDLRPDVVVHTGDLISRYDGHKRPLPADVIRGQFLVVREIMLQLRVPLLLTPGNHDTGYPCCRQFWHELMGGPDGRETDDFSVDLADVHLAVIESRRFHDPVTDHPQPATWLDQQRQWLAEDLAGCGRGRWKFLFTHYDYDRGLWDLVASLGVDGVFYGHANSPAFGPTAIDGHLKGQSAWRMLTVRGRQVDNQLGPTYAELLA